VDSVRGQEHDIFCLYFFPWIYSLLGPEYKARTISIFVLEIIQIFSDPLLEVRAVMQDPLSNLKRRILDPGCMQPGMHFES
jgi:hypothetical protein